MLRRDKTTEHYQFISRLSVFQLTEQPRTYAVFIRAAHTVADGICGATVARTVQCAEGGRPSNDFCDIPNHNRIARMNGPKQRPGSSRECFLPVSTEAGKLGYGVHNSRQDCN